MNFTPLEKLLAWMNFLPCMSLWVNTIGIPIGFWAIYRFMEGTSPLPAWSVYVAGLNITLFMITLVGLYAAIWRRTALVLDSLAPRLWYMIRINPISIMLWWLIWTIPLWIGFGMYRRDEGLVWDRTEKINANETLVRSVTRNTSPVIIQPRQRQTVAAS